MELSGRSHREALAWREKVGLPCNLVMKKLGRTKEMSFYFKKNKAPYYGLIEIHQVIYKGKISLIYKLFLVFVWNLYCLTSS